MTKLLATVENLTSILFTGFIRSERHDISGCDVEALALSSYEIEATMVFL